MRGELYHTDIAPGVALVLGTSMVLNTNAGWIVTWEVSTSKQGLAVTTKVPKRYRF